MKLFVIAAIFVSVTSTFGQSKQTKFADYPTAKYRGRIHNPKWIKRVKGGEWRDDLGKLVSDPYINFAGKYFVAVHSLGTGARYYSMTDLSTGRESDLLGRFSTIEPIPKLRDGREFLTVIYVRPKSQLVVVQYLIDYMNKPDPECRERSFLFENRKIKALTKVSYHCRELD